MRLTLSAQIVLICSGVVQQREAEVREALENAGCRILRTEHRGEWVAFLTGRAC